MTASVERRRPSKATRMVKKQCELDERVVMQRERERERSCGLDGVDVDDVGVDVVTVDADTFRCGAAETDKGLRVSMC